jgi:CO/xanthine dehydrogenase FAD-binding subunit
LYARPADFAEALRLLSEPQTRILAGGTDIFPATGTMPLRGRYVDVTALRDLRTITARDGCIRVGAAVTWSDLAKADLPPAFASLQTAAREVGGVQIQNRGTIAGNLCNASPAADGVPPLLILNAEVELASMRGRRRLPLGEFIIGSRRTMIAPDEIMSAILVPQPVPTARSSFFKLGARRYLVISIAMIAALLDVLDGTVREARIAVGSCSAVAKRLFDAERKLIGKAARPGLGDAVSESDLASLTPIDDVRGTAEFRRDAALCLLRRSLECCLSGEAGGIC